MVLEASKISLYPLVHRNLHCIELVLHVQFTSYHVEQVSGGDSSSETETIRLHILLCNTICELS
jgi:hypothetical protein